MAYRDNVKAWVSGNFHERESLAHIIQYLMMVDEAPGMANWASMEDRITTLENNSPDLSGYVLNTRTVNGHALSANVTVTKSDVGLGSVPNVDATARANHTGTQSISTISGLQAILDGKFATPAGSTGQYVRGNGTLATFPSIPDVTSLTARVTALETWRGNKYGNIGYAVQSPTNANVTILGIQVPTASSYTGLYNLALELKDKVNAILAMSINRELMNA